MACSYTIQATEGLKQGLHLEVVYVYYMCYSYNITSMNAYLHILYIYVTVNIYI